MSQEFKIGDYIYGTKKPFLNGEIYAYHVLEDNSTVYHIKEKTEDGSTFAGLIEGRFASLTDIRKIADNLCKV